MNARKNQLGSRHLIVSDRTEFANRGKCCDGVHYCRLTGTGNRGEAADPVGFRSHRPKQLGRLDLVKAPLRHLPVDRVEFTASLPEALRPGKSRSVTLAVADLNVPGARGAVLAARALVHAP